MRRFNRKSNLVSKVMLFVFVENWRRYSYFFQFSTDHIIRKLNKSIQMRKPFENKYGIFIKVLIRWYCTRQEILLIGISGNEIPLIF